MDDKLVRLSDVLDSLCKSSKPTFNLAGKPILDVDYVHAVNAIPAVDAVEVRHGRWEGNYPRAMFRLKRCSVCETLAPAGWYCFFCGAKMDGRREEAHNG